MNKQKIYIVQGVRKDLDYVHTHRHENGAPVLFTAWEANNFMKSQKNIDASSPVCDWKKLQVS
tara:strand:+ start:846 stop:1034 length:189 start_codon:yes stop_codon:yes gene_type:complete